jgi:hypothetical protein
MSTSRGKSLKHEVMPSLGGILLRAAPDNDPDSVILANVAAPQGISFECIRSPGQLNCNLSQGRPGCTDRVRYPLDLEKAGEGPVYKGIWRRTPSALSRVARQLT